MRKWFNNLKISKKLTYGFLVVSIIAVIIGVVGIFSAISSNQTNVKMYQENTLGLQYLGDAAVDLQQLRYDLLKLRKSEGSAQKDIDAQIKATKDSSTAFGAALSKCKDALKAPEYKTVLDNFNNNWKQYSDYVDKYITAATNNNFASLASISTDASTLGTKIRDDFTDLFNTLSQHAADASASTTKTSNLTVIVLIAATALGLVISLFLGLWISRQLSFPLGRLAVSAGKLADGDINLESFLTKADYEFKNRKDEVGTLALAFNKLMSGTKAQVEETLKLADGDLTTEITLRSDRDAMGAGLRKIVDSFNSLVGSIRSSAEQVESGSTLVAKSSTILSQGATEQASTVEELTASIDEIASQTTTNADNAEKANELSGIAKKDAEKGNDQMGQLLEAMDMINASSRDINKIIKVIDDIAFQTNILALNAAVEAARAGQHGKGFAVVAEEVRTLAAKSANAAKETTDMIEGSIKNVEAGIRIANDTAQALKKIVTGVSNATDLVGSIAIASKEQAMGIDQLNQGVSQVSQVIQSNAATSQESAATSEELASQAAMLKEFVSTFKLRNIPAYDSAVTATGSGSSAPRLLSLSSAGAKTSGSTDFGKY